jgi:GntR family transcriptional repressor for pyruvate dehydrogenase complex
VPPREVVTPQDTEASGSSRRKRRTLRALQLRRLPQESDLRRSGPGGILSDSMPSPRPPSETLSESVAQYVVNYVREHQLKSGETVPSELQTSSDLGVSRGIVREAYRTLKSAGVIDTANGRAPRVAKITDTGIVQLLEHAVITEQAMIHHILDLRAAIEVKGAEMAARNRKEEHVSILMEQVEKMKTSLAFPSRFVAHDMAFHATIAQATANPLFEVMVQAMRKSLAASMRTVFRNWKQRADHDQIIRTHRRIAEAICDGDPEEARRSMKLHFDEALISFSGARASSASVSRKRK